VTARGPIIPEKESFTFGSRLLHERMIAVPDDGTGLYISTINISGRRYISGIRIHQSNDKSSTLGYRHVEDEVQLLSCGAEPLRIAGFYLAEDQRGVRGLSVISDTGAVSKWVGDYESIERRRLVRSSAGQDVIKYLKGGFDVRILPQSNRFRVDLRIWFPLGRQARFIICICGTSK
jgi:hypothetical protein